MRSERKRRKERRRERIAEEGREEEGKISKKQSKSRPKERKNMRTPSGDFQYPVGAHQRPLAPASARQRPLAPAGARKCPLVPAGAARSHLRTQTSTHARTHATLAHADKHARTHVCTHTETIGHTWDSGPPWMMIQVVDEPLFFPKLCIAGQRVTPRSITSNRITLVSKTGTFQESSSDTTGLFEPCSLGVCVGIGRGRAQLDGGWRGTTPGLADLCILVKLHGLRGESTDICVDLLFPPSWFPPPLGGVAVFSFSCLVVLPSSSYFWVGVVFFLSFAWCGLPSPPLGGTAFPLSSAG